VVIKTLINLIGAIVTGTWLSSRRGFSNSLGLLFFLFHYVPNIGSILSAIPAILLAFIQLGVGPALLVAAGYLVVGFTLGNIVERGSWVENWGSPPWSSFSHLFFGGACLVRSA